MVFAWGALAPVAIFLALFYKIVWPNGEWFYVSSALSYLIPPCNSAYFFTAGSHGTDDWDIGVLPAGGGAHPGPC